MPPKDPEAPRATAVAEPARGATHKFFVLPLQLTVRDVRTTAIHIEMDCAIADAEGVSVQFMPLSVDVKTTVAEIEAILAGTIKQLAESFYKRGRAVLLPQVNMKDAPSLKELVGRSYKGSVAR